MFIIKIEF